MSKEIETIFDHNLTEEELEDFVPTKPKTEEALLRIIENDQGFSYSGIASLYDRRGNKEKKQEYRKKANDTGFKIIINDFWGGRRK